MKREISAILFDLDNTLYDAGKGLQEAGDVRITRWIMDKLNLPHDVADAMRVRTWREYGTTARGLQAEYGLEPKPLYDETIGAIEPGEYLEPWPELAAMLSRFTADRHVFTNAPAVYARKVLAALDVASLFDRIFDIEYNEWVCKPSLHIYEHIVADLGVPVERIAFIEDNPRNLVPAREMGILTVLLDGEDEDLGCDLRIGTILELADALEDAGVRA